MVQIGEVVQGLIPSGGVTGLILLMIVFGLAAFLILGIILYFIWYRKRWNIKVEIKLPRSDGKIVNGEWGKGFWSNRHGVIYIKRPGFAQKKIPMKIIDPKRYLQGADLITVIQLTPIDYRPVLPKSFLEHEVEYVDEETGEVKTVKESVLNIECDTGRDKAWQVAFDAASKKAYSLASFFKQFETPISIAIVLVAVFVGIAALWTQLPK